MTEATYTDAEYEAAQAENLLSIPWFLNAKNPENIQRRADRAQHRVSRRAEQDEARRIALANRIAKPAKSISTAPPVSGAEQVITEPSKVINVPAPKPAAKPKSSKLNVDAVIRVLVTEFGHKAGSKAEAKSAALKDGMTVAEYMADDLGFAGKWHSSHISHCVGKNFIKLEG